MSRTKYAYTYNLGSAFMGTFDSVQEALQDADDNYDDGEDFCVYIGQVCSVDLTDYAPNSEHVIEHIMEGAWDNLHEDLHEALWDVIEDLEDSAREALTNRISDCVGEWSDDFRVAKGLRKIVEIERYDVKDAD